MTSPAVPGHDPDVIRNVVIHLLSEQPLVADLFAMPTPADMTLQCTNLKTLDGRRPVFVDRSESVFFFPYQHLRFLEIPPSSVDGGTDQGDTAGVAADGGSNGPVDDLDLDLEIDEDFLRRVREA